MIDYLKYKLQNSKKTNQLIGMKLIDYLIGFKADYRCWIGYKLFAVKWFNYMGRTSAINSLVFLLFWC